jgi:hypothetical protein
MFNAERELRWKKQTLGYELLLLSRVEAAPDFGFESISSNGKSINWQICDCNAYLHNIDETHFPKGFIYKGVNGEDIDPKTIPISQRYFKDSDTATVHFVALTVSIKMTRTPPPKRRQPAPPSPSSRSGDSLRWNDRTQTL